ncbi:SWIM zinc finger family protein [Streptomyces sp. NPDC004327]|uniref:SWIM zinc finger family protein n=1 Tax=Streptomyces sp. NPDC004327 TaxID=3364699 RepID=UPI0036CD21B4
MTEQGVRWTSDQVLALAPDDASRRAGSTLGTPGPWSGTGAGAGVGTGAGTEVGAGGGTGGEAAAGGGTGGEAAAGGGAGAVWGLCKGSGRTPYRTVVDLTGPAYACSCPSRKFPCKHALGLLLLWAEGEVGAAAAPPDWAREWLTARQERVAADGAEPGPADPQAARRRAERRAARITAGARELEQRLADLLRGGLAAAEQTGYGQWEETAARMVDAQAPGLAARVRELGALPGSGPGWPVRLLEECALAHLLARAWLQADRLPAPLAATVRTRVGLTAPQDGPVVRDHWLVMAQYDSADSRLTTRRIWLYGKESGRTALLLSFGAAGRAPQLALPVGAVLDAALRPYEGAAALRAELVEQFASPAASPAAAATPPPGGPVAAALAAYGRALSEDPWLDAWPVTLADVVPARAEYGWQLADAGPFQAGEGDEDRGGDEDGDGVGVAEGIPLTRAAQGGPGLWRLVALSGGEPVTVFGEVGHEGFRPLAAWGPAAPGETVPLV